MTVIPFGFACLPPHHNLIMACTCRYDLICTDSFVPEMWMLKYQETAPGQVSNDRSLV